MASSLPVYCPFGAFKDTTMVNIRAISDELELGQDGIWYSSENEKISYPSDGNKNYIGVEDSSFWFRHRNNCIVSVVKSHPPEDMGTIFDIGGGNGFVSLALANAGFDVVLVEPGKVGAYNAKNRGVKNVICATTVTARFRKHSLPAVGLFDVVEHIEDDLSFLRSIRRLLRKDGLLYATVPSYAFLWSQEDVNAGHFRRYSLKAISETLNRVGFQVEFSSYFFRFLPVPIFFLRTIVYRLGLSRGDSRAKNISRDHGVKGGPIGNITKSMLKPEIKNLDSNRTMRFGGSCLVIARNPE